MLFCFFKHKCWTQAKRCSAKRLAKAACDFFPVVLSSVVGLQPVKLNKTHDAADDITSDDCVALWLLGVIRNTTWWCILWKASCSYSSHRWPGTVSVTTMGPTVNAHSICICKEHQCISSFCCCVSVALQYSLRYLRVTYVVLCRVVSLRKRTCAALE